MADTLVPSRSADIADPWSIPLEELDPSDGRLFQHDLHHEYFRRLRQEDPVHWSPTGPTGPYWSVTKFKDIVAVEMDPETYSSHGNISIGDQPADLQTFPFIMRDPPSHGAQRKVVAPALAPKRLSEVQALIRQRTSTLLDTLPINEEFDWVETVAVDLTVQMLATLFDMPWEDRVHLRGWSDAIVQADYLGNDSLPPQERARILGEFVDYFAQMWREKAAKPPALDFISLLAHNPTTRDMVDDVPEFMGNLTLLISGGNDTTRNSMSGSILFNHRFPTERVKLNERPELVMSMVKEVIRFQTPFSHQRRTATRNVELGGKTIRKGDRVVMWYASANRDEEEIERPCEFIIDRKRPHHHLSFGTGIHHCMGNRLAEMQLSILWEEILKRFPRIEVVGEPLRMMSNILQAYEYLPVRIPG